MRSAGYTSGPLSQQRTSCQHAMTAGLWLVASMDAAQKQLEVLLSKCQIEGIDTNRVQRVQRFFTENRVNLFGKSEKFIRNCLIVALSLYALNYYFVELQSKRCILEQPLALRYAFRPPEHCDFCANIEKVDRVRGVSSEEFAAKYAYSGTPVVVEDATSNWTALTKFNYWYFRDVYRGSKRKQKVLDCQFLPYKTGFKDLFAALDMPAARVELRSESLEPWYFGWSNCNPETAEEFRRHYGRPYFLPKASENSAVDWFFIGTAGLGAHMHIDNVRLPSWQAQLRGSKRWILAPPPECYFRCQRQEVVVRTGDIIVLDTNKWYHQTFVQPGKVSLTIGAEYD